MRFVIFLVPCALGGCTDHHEIAINTASDVLSCEPGSVDAYALDNEQWDVRGCGQRVTLQCQTERDQGYTCAPLGNTTDTLLKLGGSGN
jgi:hypothetical protein